MVMGWRRLRSKVPCPLFKAGKPVWAGAGQVRFRWLWRYFVIPNELASTLMG